MMKRETSWSAPFEACMEPLPILMKERSLGSAWMDPLPVFMQERSMSNDNLLAETSFSETGSETETSFSETESETETSFSETASETTLSSSPSSPLSDELNLEPTTTIAQDTDQVLDFQPSSSCDTTHASSNNLIGCTPFPVPEERGCTYERRTSEAVNSSYAFSNQSTDANTSHAFSHQSNRWSACPQYQDMRWSGLYPFQTNALNLVLHATSAQNIAPPHALPGKYDCTPNITVEATHASAPPNTALVCIDPSSPWHNVNVQAGPTMAAPALAFATVQEKKFVTKTARGSPKQLCCKNRDTILTRCKFSSKYSQEGCKEKLSIVTHKRGHFAVACGKKHQWVWCSHCCTCAKGPGQRGCTVTTHWFERDAFDTGARNHLTTHRKQLE